MNRLCADSYMKKGLRLSNETWNVIFLDYRNRFPCAKIMDANGIQTILFNLHEFNFLYLLLMAHFYEVTFYTLV